MRLRHLRFFALLIGLCVLESPPALAAGSCVPGDCLANSAVAQRVQPTTGRTWPV